ncbi:MAG: DUF3224 domain-containing protein [Bacteroidota bacterium]
MKISGKFSVSMKPLAAYASATEGASLGRMSLDKEYEGDLSGSSQGEMLTGMSPVAGSAGYVAIEKVSGTLMGKQGTFVLQHFGIMRGPEESRLILEVIPDSGTGELTGLSGTMDIRNEEGQHYYDFDFVLEE